MVQKVAEILKEITGNVEIYGHRASTFTEGKSGVADLVISIQSEPSDTYIFAMFFQSKPGKNNEFKIIQDQLRNALDKCTNYQEILPNISVAKGAILYSTGFKVKENNLSKAIKQISKLALETLNNISSLIDYMKSMPEDFSGYVEIIYAPKELPEIQIPNFIEQIQKSKGEN
jgi:hypothetical protein